MLWRMLMCVVWEHCLPLARGATAPAFNAGFKEAFSCFFINIQLLVMITTSLYRVKHKWHQTKCVHTCMIGLYQMGVNVYWIDSFVWSNDFCLTNASIFCCSRCQSLSDEVIWPNTGSFRTLCQLLHMSLPAYCTQASVCQMPLCLGSLLSVHSLIALCCALVSVWPTSTSAWAHRGPMGAQKEATPVAWVSAPLRRQAGSSQYGSVTTPAGCSSSLKSQNCLSVHPPRAHTFQGRLGRGAVPKLASDQTPPILSLVLLRLSLSCRSPCRGPGPLGERVWWSTVNICVKYSRNCTHSFCLWLGWLSTLYAEKHASSSILIHQRKNKIKFSLSL